MLPDMSGHRTRVQCFFFSTFTAMTLSILPPASGSRNWLIPGSRDAASRRNALSTQKEEEELEQEQEPVGSF